VSDKRLNAFFLSVMVVVGVAWVIFFFYVAHHFVSKHW
jgi:hypothetical protein